MVRVIHPWSFQQNPKQKQKSSFYLLFFTDVRGLPAARWSPLFLQWFAPMTCCQRPWSRRYSNQPWFVRFSQSCTLHTGGAMRMEHVLLVGVWLCDLGMSSSPHTSFAWFAPLYSRNWRAPAPPNLTIWSSGAVIAFTEWKANLYGSFQHRPRGVLLVWQVRLEDLLRGLNSDIYTQYFSETFHFFKNIPPVRNVTAENIYIGGHCLKLQHVNLSLQKFQVIIKVSNKVYDDKQ